MLIFLAARALASRFTFQYDFYEECSVPAGMFQSVLVHSSMQSGQCVCVADMCRCDGPPGPCRDIVRGWGTVGLWVHGEGRDVRHGIGVSANVCIFSIRERA